MVGRLVAGKSSRANVGFGVDGVFLMWKIFVARLSTGS